MKILTFDFEDWFHILDNSATESPDLWNNFPSRAEAGLERILELLSRHDLRGTFFVLGWMADKYPNLVRKIAASGHHIGSHSYSHQLVYSQSRDAFKEDVYRSKLVLEALIGEPVKAYRAPGFSITGKNLWAFEELVNLGFEIDCSVFPAGRAHGGMPFFEERVPCISSQFDKPLKFFPINYRVFFGVKYIYSGGGYFRLCPEWLLRKFFVSDDYVMTYFHPRDFDPHQPSIPGLNPIRKFKSFFGLRSAAKKLDVVMLDNRFVSLDEADRGIDWSCAPQIVLT